MGFFLSGDWKLCGQAARASTSPLLEKHTTIFAVLVGEQPDLTLD